MKKILLKVLWLLSLSLLLSMAGTALAWAEEVYTVTEAELTQLGTNLAKLDSINKQQRKELTEQKMLLSQAQFDLEELQNALSESRQELKLAQNSLQNANQSLEQYAREEKSKRLLIKRQRNFYYCLAVALGAGLIYKPKHL